METASIISIILKWSIGVFVVWGLWFLFLRRINQFVATRLFITLGLLLSVFLPILAPWLTSITIPSAASFPLISNVFLPEITFSASISESDYNPITVIIVIAGIVSSLFLVRFTLNLLRILSLSKTGKKIKENNITLVEHSKDIPPFSFFNLCFINPNKIPTDKANLIIAHEVAHKKHLHSVDQIFIELFGVIQWFNPFYWILKKTLIEIHEFQADEVVIKESAETHTYMDSIVSIAFSGIALSLGNNFNKSLTLKRLAMMNTKKVKRFAIPATLLSFALAFSLLFIISCEKSDTQEVFEDETILTATKTQGAEGKSQVVSTDEVFVVVENMPKFMGDNSKSHDKFRSFIAENLVYPEIALENGIQGRVFVSFIVEVDGSVSNVKIVRGVDPSLDQEAVRVVESSPRWEPGTQKGTKVRVTFTFPISFSLK